MQTWVSIINDFKELKNEKLRTYDFSSYWWANPVRKNKCNQEICQLPKPSTVFYYKHSWTNLSQQDETWAEYSSLDLAVVG